jgi:hypothetical protein
LHVHHVVSSIDRFPGAFFLKVSILSFAEEASSGIESFSGEETVSLCEFLTFSDKLPVFVLNELALGSDGFFT